MSNIRLIVFVKIPGRVEPIPLDILDSSSTNLVLVDILIIAGLSSQDKPVQNYLLLQNGRKLDLSLRLSENGVKNGSALELIPLELIPIENTIDIINNKKISQNTKEESNQVNSNDITSSNPQKNNEVEHKNKSSVPGKKIDFD
jgi:hypothetical protein